MKDYSISGKTVERLSLYRRILLGRKKDGATHVYSHELAELACGSAVQVRRDLMSVGCEGHTNRGYDVPALIDGISRFLDAAETQGVALAGVGNLGRAVLAYVAWRQQKLVVKAAFDSDPAKIDRVINGCRVYSIDAISAVLAREKIMIGILAVPAEQAQEIAEKLISAGVRGILNFTPVRLQLPEGVYVENLDMTVSLEKVAYFTRHPGTADGGEVLPEN